MIEVVRAEARYTSEQPGLVTRHCFSAGHHYDPDNTAFGPLVGVDEHVLAPGAGFTRHAHRGVEIVSWVLAGTLRHEPSDGSVELIGPGVVLHQSAGSGIEHIEANASSAEPLHFVQTVFLSDVGMPRVALDAPPLSVGGGEFAVLPADVSTTLPAAAHLHLYVARGSVVVAGGMLRTGDSVRARDESVRVAGHGEVLVWRSDEGHGSGVP